MAYTLRMMVAIENHLISQGCTIIGPMSTKEVPDSLFIKAESLPPVGLKRFIRCNNNSFLLHIYVQDWADRIGATLNVDTYGSTTSKTVQRIHNFYSDFDPAKFIKSMKITPPSD